MTPREQKRFDRRRARGARRLSGEVRSTRTRGKAKREASAARSKAYKAEQAKDARIDSAMAT